MNSANHNPIGQIYDLYVKLEPNYNTISDSHFIDINKASHILCPAFCLRRLFSIISVTANQCYENNSF